MANKTLFSSIKSMLPRTDTRSTRPAAARTSSRRSMRWRRWLPPAASTACTTRALRASSTNMRKLIDQVDDNVFLAKLAVYARERAFMKDMPAAAVGRAVEARHGADAPRVRSGRGQRSRSAHPVPDDPFGTVRSHEPVVSLAAGVPAVAERGIGRQVAVGFDR